MKTSFIVLSIHGMTLGQALNPFLIQRERHLDEAVKCIFQITDGFISTSMLNSLENTNARYGAQESLCPLGQVQHELL